jgi:hypothetical protein
MTNSSGAKRRWVWESYAELFVMDSGESDHGGSSVGFEVSFHLSGFRGGGEAVCPAAPPPPERVELGNCSRDGVGPGDVSRA